VQEELRAGEAEKGTAPEKGSGGLPWFLALAFGMAWSLTAPLWVSGQGLKHPAAPFLLVGMMLTPALAVLIVTRWIAPLPNLREATGLRLSLDGRRWLPYWVFSWLGIPALVFAAPFVGALLGLYRLDLTEFSYFRSMLLKAPGGEQVLRAVPVQALVLIQVVQACILAPLLNSLFTFGEEWGWRGYLLPRLLPLGQWPAILLSGAIWGVWHAPVILLGYNYPQSPVLGVFMMTGLCVIFGILFGWTRLATGSVWPAVIGHAALNGSAGAVILFAREGAEPDAAVVGITGWTGWILPLVVIAALIATRRLPVPDPPDAGRWAGSGRSG
jgi:membrane protease YdiL (CAAX protease family)